MSTSEVGDAVVGSVEVAGLEHAPARRVRRLARRASRRRTRGEQAFAGLAARTRVDLRTLRLLADAWDEGGASGVEALRVPPDVEHPAVQAATEELDLWRRRHFLLEVLQLEVWRNRLTVWRMLPPAERTGAPEPVPLLQLRVTGRARWHLFRKAAHGEWWPVVVHGTGRDQSLADCLHAARVDAGNRFWRRADDAPD